ncbi:class I SAM-dependent methyltransferase [Sneathiella sp.]|jgi:hypothetical protein|uniref:class I SAM-dependent methyltransferase n=1 Tax=Sneathiella sp. TaxID=1964365 RepID=UPI0039E6697F
MFLKKIHSLPPVLAAAFIQLVVFGTLSVLLPQLQVHLTFSVPLFWQLVLQGGFAAAISFALGQSYWWVIIQFFGPPLLIIGLIVNVPIWVYPVVLVLLLATFWNVAVNRVPLYLTNDLTAQKIETLLPKRDGLQVIDLGSGLGGTMRQIGKNQPGHFFFGAESAPAPFIVSVILNKVSGAKNVRFLFGSFWKLDLEQFDVVYCFLSPVPMSALFEKAKSEMKPGSLFISNSFQVPGHKPDRTVTVKDGRKTKLLIWKI